MHARVASSSSLWSRERDKAFENALAIYLEDCNNPWEKIAEAVPGVSIEEIKYHYQLLVEDINSIESGKVPLPQYGSEGLADLANDGGERKKEKTGHKRVKGTPWRIDEHKRFLAGLQQFGKGDWRSISRYCVITRTPTQVASHAQKYFKRLASEHVSDRRRTSIHDITTLDDEDGSGTDGPITGAGTGTNSQPQSPAGSSGFTPHSSNIGQQFEGALVSAIGTPASLPVAPVGQPMLHPGLQFPQTVATGDMTGGPYYFRNPTAATGGPSFCDPTVATGDMTGQPDDLSDVDNVN